MKNFKKITLLFLLSFLTFSALAQRGGGGWCSNNNYSKLFNKQTLETLSGTIVSIEKIIPETGMSKGIHLNIKTNDTVLISIHLGPEWYLDNQDIQFVVGDAIKVKGSRVTYLSKPAIIAMTILRGEDQLSLRDKNGFPNWSGWRKGIGINKTKN